MHQSVYLVRKPLQYFNATNIENPSPKTCLFVDKFFEAEDIFNKVKNHSSFWDEVLFFRSNQQVYNWIIKNKGNIEKLFIDSDFGISKYFTLRQLSTIKIFVYEEGMGTYSTRRWGNDFKSKTYRFFYTQILKNHEFPGGYRFLEGLYVYNKEIHRETHPNYTTKYYNFKKSFHQHLNTFPDKDIFFDRTIKEKLDGLKGEKILLYLTSYKYNDDVEKILIKYPFHKKILKPHPHIKHNINKTPFDIIINNNVFVELMISYLMEIGDEILVLHENSAAIMYLQENSKLQIQNL